MRGLDAPEGRAPEGRAPKGQTLEGQTPKAGPFVKIPAFQSRAALTEAIGAP